MKYTIIFDGVFLSSKKHSDSNKNQLIIEEKKNVEAK
jgi:hypothetical protein